MFKRLRSAEVANGYPGFPYHQATTEDLTVRLERFVVRPIPGHPGHWQVHYYKSNAVPVARINRKPRTWLGRLWTSWDH